MITFEAVNKEEFEKECLFINENSVLFSEYDHDFFDAKEKIDLDLINEKIRLELYKI